MATLRTAVAAAARASSLRGSGLAAAGSRGGAGSGSAVLSSRGGPGCGLAVLSSRRVGGSLPLVRGFSDGGKIPNPKSQPPLWSWKNWRSSAQAFAKKVKALDEVWKVAYAAHGVVYLFFTTAAGYAIWYVEGSVAEERRSREIFERAAVSGHQEHVQHTIESIEKLQEKINRFWDRFLSYREDDLLHRDTVTKSAALLKKKGYVVVSAADFEALDSKMGEMIEMLAEMSELKAKLLMLIESKENQANSGKQQGPGEIIPNCAQPATSDATALKNQANSGKQQGPGESIPNCAQPATSAATAVKNSADSGKKNGPGSGAV